MVHTCKVFVLKIGFEQMALKHLTMCDLKLPFGNPTLFAIHFKSGF